MQSVNQLSAKDLRKFFSGYFKSLPGRLGLLMLKYETQRDTRLKICFYNMLCESFPPDKVLYPLASLVASGKETLLFQTPDVFGFFEFIEEWKRKEGLNYMLIPHFAVTIIDATGASKFYRQATYQSQDLINGMYENWQKFMQPPPS